MRIDTPYIDHLEVRFHYNDSNERKHSAASRDWEGLKSSAICTHLCPSTRIHLLSYEIFNERLSVIVKIPGAFIEAFLNTQKSPILTEMPLSNLTQC